MTMTDNFKYARPEGQQRRRDAYGAIYADALGTIVPPTMGEKSMQGPEGQLWQGLQQQQAFAQSQAGRRGYDPSMARGASQANAELESQGYGAAQGIREQQAAYARQAKLGLLRQRSAQDAAQSGIEGSQLGQTYSDQAFDAQAKDDMQAQKEAAENRTQDAAFNAIGSVAGVVGKAILSDENQKKNMKDGGMAADKLMASLAMPQNRAEAKKYWNTPIGYARPPIDDEVIAQLQRSSDENDAEDASEEDILLAELQRSSDANDNEAAISPAEINAARVQALTASLNERDRAAENAPNPADAAGKPVRGADGTWMMPGYRPGEEITNVRHLVDPMARPTMTRDEARARLGFKRPIDPRSAAIVAAQMPQNNEYGATIRSAASEARRAKADADSQELANFFNQRAAEFEGKARAPEAVKRAEVLDSFDKYAADATRELQPKMLNGALDAAAPRSFDYKDGAGPSGPQLGVTAQNLQGNPLTAATVVRSPQGLAIDPAKAVGPMLGMLGQVGKRLKRVEARK